MINKACVCILVIFFSNQIFAQAKFPKPKQLRANISFWKKVYSQWGKDKVILFDKKDLSIVYKVIDFSKYKKRLTKKDKKRIVKRHKNRLVRILRNLDKIKPKNSKRLNKTSKKVYWALQHIKGKNKYKRAKYIGTKNGLRDNFALGLRLSGRYIDDIKRYLKQNNLPEELVAIVFVESLFYAPAKSKYGAAGLWQLMKHTAKETIVVNRLVDERYDPILATKSAIKYLSGAKKKFKKWPVAITSYNYGRSGMSRAIKKTGSNNLMKIIKKYKHRRFGFSSKNYYAEFLAALEVYQARNRYFPEVVARLKWQYKTYNIPYPIYLGDLIGRGALTKKEIKKFNPAIRKFAFLNREVLPKGFAIRIPKHKYSRFHYHIRSMPKSRLIKAARQIRTKHRANGRQSIDYIAKKHGISQKKLASRLGYSKRRKPSRGTVIIIRSADSKFTAVP